jgi:hypothetical protein
MSWYIADHTLSTTPAVANLYSRVEVSAHKNLRCHLAVRKQDCIIIRTHAAFFTIRIQTAFITIYVETDLVTICIETDFITVST